LETVRRQNKLIYYLFLFIPFFALNWLYIVELVVYIVVTIEEPQEESFAVIKLET